ncbi:MAG: SMI1/KNR4 family protein, partial [Chloroflexota bacterium]|nr:SMI1/KNR4 family protein [Chloroflexota bacterium]
FDRLTAFHERIIRSAARHPLLISRVIRSWRYRTREEMMFELVHPVAPSTSVATDDDLDRVERTYGCQLPSDYRTFLKVFGPGTLDDGTFATEIFSPGEVVARTEELRDLLREPGEEPPWYLLFFDLQEDAAAYFGVSPSMESGKGERITAPPSPQNWACELSPHPAQANHDASACLLLADGPRRITVNLVMAIKDHIFAGRRYGARSSDPRNRFGFVATGTIKASRMRIGRIGLLRTQCPHTRL